MLQLSTKNSDYFMILKPGVNEKRDRLVHIKDDNRKDPLIQIILSPGLNSQLNAVAVCSITTAIQAKERPGSS